MGCKASRVSLCEHVWGTRTFYLAQFSAPEEGLVETGHHVLLGSSKLPPYF